MHLGHLHISVLQIQAVSEHGHSFSQISQITGFSFVNMFFTSSLLINKIAPTINTAKKGILNFTGIFLT
tara:strand:+ start:227 stop:433 length:207 start_codon:yes stop_codon:yes gene_type:complete